MAKWEYHGEYKAIRCGTNIEKEQKEALGYGGRIIEVLRCTACNKLTFLDNSIRYDYCPHCGDKMQQYWEPVYPTWEEWLQSVGVMESAECIKNLCQRELLVDGIVAHAIPTRKVLDPIPADIAEKLGIEPKEG